MVWIECARASGDDIEMIEFDQKICLTYIYKH